MARMHRTQVFLDEEQARALHLLARRRGTTRSQLLRLAARRFLDQDFSYVDGTSFVTMNRLELLEALAYDQHFLTVGFVPPQLEE